jgi:hypothetical protein
MVGLSACQYIVVSVFVNLIAKTKERHGTKEGI